MCINVTLLLSMVHFVIFHISSVLCTLWPCLSISFLSILFFVYEDILFPVWRCKCRCADDERSCVCNVLTIQAWHGSSTHPQPYQWCSQLIGKGFKYNHVCSCIKCQSCTVHRTVDIEIVSVICQHWKFRPLDEQVCMNMKYLLWLTVNCV